MKTSLRIASYNVRKARGLDQRRNPERTLQVINDLGADIVLLQEADKRLGPRKAALPRDMIERETDFSVVDVAHNDVSLGWHGNAILVADHVEYAGIERLSLPGLEPRGAVRIDVAIGAGLSMVATHLGLRRKDRRAQLDRINAAVAHKTHVAIVGDFNEWSDKKGLEPLASRFAVHAPGKTFHASRPVAALDRIALSHGVEMQNAGVAQTGLARQASDHLPIWSDISVPPVTPTC
ncbi:endonuclease/exonuclease/phosphatase family protein [Tateyamaria sp. SN3-11]|uniref:endonuclease/exonuclease/phosphatase family protein n=1 Tax=Tateyamaria sp. SN3-11 TaxID=3092147 RepID=UPI0039E8A1AD